MQRASRFLALSVIALVALGGCKRKPPVVAAQPPQQTPVSNPTPAPAPPTETCDAACREARDAAARSAVATATAALTATIYFHYDASDITDESRVKLDAKVPVMSQNGTVRIRIAGDREMTFGDVRIRVDPNFALAMHIDTDEANAANLGNGAQGFIDGIQDD